MTDRRSFLSLLRNPMSFIGGLLVVVSTAVGVPLVLFDLFSAQTTPYRGIFAYLILPVVAAGGLGLAIAGMAWERRRRRRSPDQGVPLFPVLDLNQPRSQSLLVGAFAAGVFLLVLFSVTGYRSHQFTDSVAFCGQVCHSVMKPEFTAYRYSPHARVDCVACHVGPGAGWFVRSKLSGSYQVYAVAFHKYPRPIETPVSNLRPAQETCEQCHWPAKFFGAQQKTFTHYFANEKNSPWQIQALLKIGGGDSKVGATSGIHWHMNIKNDIYYRAADQKREEIPWIRVVDPQGHVTEYMTTEQPLTPAQIAKLPLRRMDCVDCHNRPSHIFYPPDRAVDQAFEAGRLDSTLPYLKREAMRLLAGSYPSEAEALSAIFQELPAFYQANYPALSREKAAAIQQAAETVQQLFSRNVFPEMRTDWRAHANHVGHLTSDGCFRCHDGLHTSREGKVITHDCNACHTILAQGPPGQVASAKLQAQPFRHPVDLGMDVTQLKCSQCHTGTTGL